MTIPTDEVRSMGHDRWLYHAQEGARLFRAGEAAPAGWALTPTDVGLVGTPGATEHEKVWLRDPDAPRAAAGSPSAAPAAEDERAAMIAEIGRLSGKKPHPGTGAEKLRARLVELKG